MSLAASHTEAWAAAKAAMGVSATYDGTRSITVVQQYTADDTGQPAGSRHQSPTQQLSVDNDATTGISADEFVPGKTVTLTPRSGAAARDFRLTRIVKQNATFVTYEAH